MAKFDNYLIATDLDGTFLGDGEKFVKRNLEAIEYFKANGGLFTAATGRDIYCVEKSIPGLTALFNAPMITSNGACIYDTVKKSVECLLEPDKKSTLNAIAALEPIRNKLKVRLSVKDGYIYENESEIIAYDIPAYLDVIKIARLEDSLNEDWLKICIFGTKQDVAEASRILKMLDAPELHFVSAYDENVEILAHDATKGKKLSALKNYLGNDKLKIAAIGDYYNDYEMISMADIPATVENGVPELKNIPGVFVAGTNNNGAIADLIEHLETL